MPPDAERPGDSGQHFRMAAMHLWMGISTLCKRSNLKKEERQKNDNVSYHKNAIILRDNWQEANVPCIIYPVHPMKEMWDIFILMLILYSSISIPIRVCFDADAHGAFFFVEAFFSIVFVIDVCFNFFTAVLEDGQWVVGKCSIAKRYMSGWFWIDAPASVPMELLSIYWEQASHLGFMRFLRMFRMLRLLKLLKVDQYVNLLEEHLNANLRFLRIVQMTLKMLFLAHLLGCFWYYVAIESGEEVTWITSYSDGDAAAPDADVSKRYLYSLYWALTTLTTVGYGDITPQNDAERLYTSVALLIGALVFGYILTDIGSLVQSMDRKSVLIEEAMDSVKEYVMYRRLPRSLAVRIRHFYDHLHQNTCPFNEKEILANLSPELQQETVAYMLADTILRVPIIADLDQDFHRVIFDKLVPNTYSAKQIIFRKGDPSQEIMFLLEGTVDAVPAVSTLATLRIQPRSETLVTFLGEETASLDARGYFGEQVIFGMRRSADHVATTRCNTLNLSRNSIDEIFSIRPDIACAMIQAIASDLQKKHRLYTVMMRAAISFLPETSDGYLEQAAVLRIQLAYRQFVQRNHERFTHRMVAELSMGVESEKIKIPGMKNRRSVASALPAMPSQVQVDRSAAEEQLHMLERITADLEGPASPAKMMPALSRTDQRVEKLEQGMGECLSGLKKLQESLNLIGSKLNTVGTELNTGRHIKHTHYSAPTNARTNHLSPQRVIPLSADALPAVAESSASFRASRRLEMANNREMKRKTPPSRPGCGSPPRGCGSPPRGFAC